MENFRFAILASEDRNNNQKWIRACEKLNQKYEVVDMMADSWLADVKTYNPDCCLIMPSVDLTYLKKMYDEKIYILSEILHYLIYPSFHECMIYENKRLLSYFLKATNLPHPATLIIYEKEEALTFARETTYPIVGKMNLGSAGAGIDILQDQKAAQKYIKRAFSKKGLRRRFGPNKNLGSPTKWTRKALQSPAFFVRKIKSYIQDYSDSQRHFVIFQDYIPHDFEWRVVKIDNSYFAHKKMKIAGKASGSKIKDYNNPPLRLFDFAKAICEKNHFNSMSIDIFEDSKGNYLINELQTLFGQSDEFQMLVDGQAGRYVFKNNQWIFEKGDFNTNQCFDLRLEHAINLLKRKNENIVCV